LADPALIVPQLLAAAGISPSAEEVAALVDGYPALRASLDRIQAVEAARYEEPGLIFSAII
jgi:hypothetical protein